MTVEHSLVLPPFLSPPVAGSHLHRFLSAQRTHLRQLERRRQRSESRSCRCCLRRCQRRCLRSLLVFVVVFFIIGLKLICQLHDLTFNWLTPTTTRRWGSRHGAYDPFRFVSFRSVPSSAEARSLLPRSLDRCCPFLYSRSLLLTACVFLVYASLGLRSPWAQIIIIIIIIRRSSSIVMMIAIAIAAWQTSSLAMKLPLNIVAFDLSK